MSHHLEANSFIVNQCPGDADTAIVSTASEYAALGTEVNLVADDTGKKIIMADVFFHSEARKSLQTTALSWNVRDLVSKAGNLIVSHLLLVHAWSGCDTTSATFGHGKTTLLKKLKASEVIQEISSVLCNPNASQEEIGQTGLRLFVILYGGKQQDSLNGLWREQHISII